MMWFPSPLGEATVWAAKREVESLWCMEVVLKVEWVCFSLAARY